METLAAYLPPDRQLALASGAHLADRASGAALFADISGFTPLTSALARELGPQRGAEELTRQLNFVYGALIAEVERYGGSVISFSGDAITCWFDESFELAALSAEPDAADAQNAKRKAQTSAALRAAACALAMQAAMRQFAALATPGGASFAIQIKIAISSGTCRRFLVGNRHIQLIDVLAGSILDRISAAQQHALPGDVLIGADEARVLGAALRLRGWRPGADSREFAVVASLAQPVAPQPWPALPALGPEAAREWLLPPVYQRLRRGEGQFLAELRATTALFLTFSGVNYDHDPDAGARLDAFVSWAQARLAQYEGHLLQLTVGDKGSYLYASFGAPTAHEDDPARAIAAALALLATPPELSFIHDIRVGISQGQMHAGAYGGPTRRTYGVLGNDVNVAARLMTFARPGQILATQRAALAAAQLYEFDDLGAVTLKGHPEAIQVYAVVGRRPERPDAQLKGRALTAMVGRADERARLADRLHAALAGLGGTLLIEGEAGIGKSRLAADLAEHAAALGITVLHGAGESIEAATPYYAWRPIYRQLFGLDDSADAATALAHVRARLPDASALNERLPLLNAVLPLALPDSALTSQMSGEVRIANTQELLIGILARAPRATAALLVVLEDAHWIDSASWALALQAQRDLPDMLLVLTSRPLELGPGSAAPEGYRRLMAAPAAERLLLGALGAGETIALVCQRLGVASIPHQVAELIRQRAEGHPFFSEELAFALRDAGLIRVSGGQCSLAPEAGDLRALDFPQTIQGVITSRIDRLPLSQQLTLKVASVIGRIFLQRTLQSVHPIESDRPYLHDYLSALERLDITPLERPEPDLAYIFKHAIIQDVAYNMLLFAQRWELHRHIAEWYEQTYADDLAPYYPLLAHHWLSAVESRQADVALVLKAIDYLEKAGEHALRSYANQEAIRFFGQALELAQSLPQAPEAPRIEQLRLAHWARQLGEAYKNIGMLAESREQLERALSILGRPLPTNARAQVAGMLAAMLRQAGRRVRLGGVGHPDAATRAVELEASHVYLTLSSLYYVLNEIGLVLYTLLQAVNLAERAGPSPELAEAYSGMAVVAGLIPLHNTAETYARLAEATAHQLDRLTTSAFVFTRVSLYRGGVGQWESVIRDCRQAIAIAERLGDQALWGEAVAIMRGSTGFTGNLVASDQLAGELYDTARRNSHQLHEVWGLSQLASSKLLLGQIDQAFEMATQCLARIDATGVADELNRITAYGVMATAQLWRGNHAEARQLADVTARLLPASGRTSYAVFESYMSVAEVYLMLWEKARSAATDDAASLRAAARQACRALWRFARIYPIALPRAWMHQGQFHWLNGRPERAHAAWHTSADLARRMQMRYHQGLAHFEIGRHLPADLPEQRAQLHRARELFEQTGGAHALAEVRALLA
ncbi:AAA family ATPase [Kouleothrix sp.]|uniref:AAA family ATPase n=1 Tax=Kouleothrix sp. TaxID=2779161 RepID=UPI003918D998